jgi:hypothetical protein
MMRIHYQIKNMKVVYLFIMASLLLQQSLGFNTWLMTHQVNRRDMMIKACNVLTTGSLASLSFDNKKMVMADTPLTPEEMDEYNRLLKEAKRIQGLIDMNKKAAEEDMADTKFAMKKAMLKRFFPMVYDHEDK